MSITVKLSRPVTVIDQTFTELTLREPTGLDLRLAGDSDNRQEYVMRLLAQLANITPAAIDGMPARDVIALGKVVSGFLADPDPETSSTDTSSAPDGGATPRSLN